MSLNKIGHALHELNPVFRKVSLSEKVKECAFQLGFLDPVIAQSMYIFKNPGIGSEGLFDFVFCKNMFTFSFVITLLVNKIDSKL